MKAGHDFLGHCVTRRQFLFMGAAAITAVALAEVLPGQALMAQVAVHQGKKVGTLSGLRVGVPRLFRYPWGHPNCDSYLIKLGVPAGGGIGPDHDVVAFNVLCTHMGVSLKGHYNAEYQVLGPCPLHLTTFDLTRHGIVVAGHATQELPQVVLEAHGDDIYATGIMALVYGFADNGVAPA